MLTHHATLGYDRRDLFGVAQFQQECLVLNDFHTVSSSLFVLAMQNTQKAVSAICSIFSGIVLDSNQAT
jgi:hypothetical protein